MFLLSVGGLARFDGGSAVCRRQNCDRPVGARHTQSKSAELCRSSGVSATHRRDADPYQRRWGNVPECAAFLRRKAEICSYFRQVRQKCLNFDRCCHEALGSFLPFAQRDNRVAWLKHCAAQMARAGRSLSSIFIVSAFARNSSVHSIASLSDYDRRTSTNWVLLRPSVHPHGATLIRNGKSNNAISELESAISL